MYIGSSCSRAGGSESLVVGQYALVIVGCGDICCYVVFLFYHSF